MIVSFLGMFPKLRTTVPFRNCPFRMLAKLKEVVQSLNEINNKIDAAYSAGVVDGFSKQPCPKYSIFLGVFSIKWDVDK